MCDTRSEPMEAPKLVRIKPHAHAEDLRTPIMGWFAVLDDRMPDKVHIGNGYERVWLPRELLES